MLRDYDIVFGGDAGRPTMKLIKKGITMTHTHDTTDTTEKRKALLQGLIFEIAFNLGASLQKIENHFGTSEAETAAKSMSKMLDSWSSLHEVDPDRGAA